MTEPAEPRSYECAVLTSEDGSRAYYRGKYLGCFATTDEAYRAIKAAAVPDYQRIDIHGHQPK